MKLLLHLNYYMYAELVETVFYFRVYYTFINTPLDVLTQFIFLFDCILFIYKVCFSAFITATLLNHYDKVEVEGCRCLKVILIQSVQF